MSSLDHARRAPSVSLAAAISEDWIIGAGNRLPWHLPQDLRRFRRLTTGHAVIMGRRTYEAIGRPLPRRRNIVISRQPPRVPAGVEPARSLEDALALCGAEKRVFVIGGGEVFREALPIADRIHLTVIYVESRQIPLFEPLPGDARFPPIEPTEWRIRRLGQRRVARLATGQGAARGGRGLYYRFIDLERSTPPSGRSARPGLEGRFHWSRFARAARSGG